MDVVLYIFFHRGRSTSKFILGIRNQKANAITKKLVKSSFTLKFCLQIFGWFKKLSRFTPCLKSAWLKSKKFLPKAGFDYFLENPSPLDDKNSSLTQGSQHVIAVHEKVNEYINKTKKGCMASGKVSSTRPNR